MVALFLLFIPALNSMWMFYDLACLFDTFTKNLQFRDNFRIKSLTDVERSFHSALAFALETREGTLEEVALNIL